MWQRVAYHSRSSLAACQLGPFCCRPLQLCLQAAPRARQTPWGAQKKRRAFQRTAGKTSSLWFKSDVTPVGRGFAYLMPLWAGKVCRLSPGQGREKKRQEKAGVGRGEGKACGKEEEEERKSLWGWSK